MIAEPVYEYREDLADRAVKFLECLRLPTASFNNQARDLLKLAPWQENIVRDLFGYVRADTGMRQYRTAYIEIPRKNGKTTLAAAFCLLTLFMDNEEGAQVIGAATTREQAELLYQKSVRMINLSPSLKKRTKEYKSQHRIMLPSINGFMRAVPADPDYLHGLDIHCCVADEVHAWRRRDLWDVLETGTASRGQPLIVGITTAGHDRSSLCWQLHEYALSVADGRVKDPTFYPVVYGASEDDDWTDPKVWAKANPNYGVSVNPEYLAKECAKAQKMPAYESAYRRLHLNQWTSVETRWLSMDDWAKCA